MGIEPAEHYAYGTRRRFLANGLVPILLLPALVRAASGRVHTRAAGEPGGSGAVRSTNSADGRLTTPVYIDGSGPYRFLVDTGSERSVLAEEVAAHLRLPVGSKVLVEGIVRSMPAQLVRIERLALGTLTCWRLEVPTLPRDLLGVDGILGLDVLNGRRVIFDFASRTLKVTRTQGFLAAMWSRLSAVSVRTLGQSGRLRATDCSIDGIPAAAFIDTGANVTVSNLALFSACQRRDPALKTLGTLELSGVTGGTTLGRVALFERFRLGALMLTDTPVIVVDLAIFDLWGLRHQPALLMGMNCLRCFTWVSIDYGRKELNFEVPDTSARPVEPPALQPIL